MTRPSPIYDALRAAREEGRPQLYLLVDPDKAELSELPAFVTEAEQAGVDGFFVGGSLALLPQFEQCLSHMKIAAGKPVIIFPGGVHQISGMADAILFLSIVSGRNAEQLIGQHVIAAPMVFELGLEAISTAYIIVSSDTVTSTEYMSYSKPVPRHKPEIAAAHALAADMLGMKLVYLEAGSGATQTVPADMVAMVSRLVDIPVMVGGGITTPEAAAEKAAAGADIVIIGNHFEHLPHRKQLGLFADAVHSARHGGGIDI
jgi:phosphoglycerol geranylgeranyltransferase